MKNIFKLTFIIIISAILIFYIFDTVSCFKRSFNNKVEFTINFEKGSSEFELISFSNDFKQKYPNAEIFKIRTDKQSIEDAVKINRVKDSEKGKYIKGIEDFVTAEITIRASVNDLSSLEEFNLFISNTLNKYKTLTIRGFGGSVPENVLSNKSQTITWCLIPRPIQMFLFVSSF